MDPRVSRIGRMGPLAGALLITFVVWLSVAWPLPKYFGECIPAGAGSGGTNPVRTMFAGDHLQLLYYFNLFGDMIQGRVRPGYNVFEFNTGNDADRWQPEPYYFPFSGVYSILHGPLGMAGAWNLTGFLSLWMTAWATWRLARRYTAHDTIAALMALLVVLSPYRWVNLLGGSPMGFAALWLPVMLLGLDIAVRDGRVVGGWLAGLAILCACWTDQHVFFFAALLAPFWCVVAILARNDFRRRLWPSDLSRLLRALAPVMLLALAAVAFRLWQQSQMGAATIARQREWWEIALFSPHAVELFAWRMGSWSSQAYFGYGVLAVLAAGCAWFGVAAIRKPQSLDRRAWVFLLLMLAIAGVVVLALGPYGPFEGRCFAALRKCLPPYRMVRQSAKILCMLPVLCAVAGALALSAVTVRWPRWMVGALCLVLGAGMTWEYARRVDPLLCRLENRQSAYAAVAHDASRSGPAAPPARALVVPLWPGDAHQTSVYQTWAELYRIRLVNGYSPVVDRAYMEQVFRRFASVNQGRLDDAQVDALLARGIRYIVLHEDLFPEKISPFPVGATMEAFLNHPRMAVLMAGAEAGRLFNEDPAFLNGPVRAFRLLEQPRTNIASVSLVSMLCAARRWDAGAMLTNAVEQISPDPGRPGTRRLSRDGAWLETQPETVDNRRDLTWWMRLRGAGEMAVTAMTDSASNMPVCVVVTNGWVSAPVPRTGRYEAVRLRLARIAGVMDVEEVVLAGGWAPPAIGETRSLKAAELFRAGSMDLVSGAVRFAAQPDPPRTVLYGPCLPIAPGRYRVSLVYASAAPSGSVLGWMNTRGGSDCESPDWLEIRQGEPATQLVAWPDGWLFRIELMANSRWPLTVESLTIDRLE